MAKSKKITPSRKIDSRLSSLLKEKAGGKCANPGCPNHRTEIHHIKKWSIYKTHDEQHMVAICPSCHSEAHRGNLSIDDETIYRWKNIARPTASRDGQLYIEPSPSISVRIGGLVTVTTPNKLLTAFRMNNQCYLQCTIVDQDIIFVSGTFKGPMQEDLVRLINNHVRVSRDAGVQFEFSRGRVKVTTPSSANYVPPWLIQQLRYSGYSNFVVSEKVIILDIEITDIGKIQLFGCWRSEQGYVVAGPNGIFLCHESRAFSIQLNGPKTGDAVFHFIDDPEKPVLGFD